MPIYEYACGSCEHRFETIQRASEGVLRDCPECGEAALKKLLSAPNFRLKGSGWYETDFKTGDKRNVAQNADAEGGAKSGNGEDAKGGEKDSGGKGGEQAAGSKAESGTKAESGAKADSGKGDGGSAKAKPAEPKGSASKKEKK